MLDVKQCQCWPSIGVVENFRVVMFRYRPLYFVQSDAVSGSMLASTHGKANDL